ncbi:hypothetical protein G7078_04545 [Sphingomonas sinipercae]|uniref:Uncharacterized protein n=1 Tax=Sphingomonas sinipercae TaxID=2714944 RepID=A0A6G7ZMI3_9SPHN|nr:hypothetical protein [Sphingomonas sinipercae]QIL02128.1 hypothetical protein G7078_04545 [Sphingomonas sinipercae]
MRLLPFAVAVLFCAGCDPSVDDTVTPAARDIERLERMLAAHPCVGPLDRWERNYRFSRRSGLLFGHSLNPEMDVIEFHLRRAGTVVVLPGRYVMAPPPNGDWPDSRPIEALDGKLTLSSGKLAMTPCASKRAV